jgi:hypothetical protein
MKFRKKPVVIEAVQWTGTVSDELLALFGYTPIMSKSSDPDAIYVGTLEGEMRASPGDWIIKGIKGELYPCKPDIFAATYEPA